MVLMDQMALWSFLIAQNKIAQIKKHLQNDPRKYYLITDHNLYFFSLENVQYQVLEMNFYVY